MKTFHEYLREFKKLTAEGNPHPELKKIKIALLSSFNINGFKEILYVQCREAGIDADIYLADYGQYNQEILDPHSKLYVHQPQIIIVFIDTGAFFGDYIFKAYDNTSQQRRKFIREKFAELLNLIRILKDNSPAALIVHNLEVPPYSPMGILENKQEFGLKESIEEFNRCLAKGFQDDPRCFIYDFQSRLSQLGRQSLIDQRLYYIGDIKLAFHSVSDITKDYLGYIKAHMSLSRKCLVLDLDHTLWGGILGEDGLEGIHLGPTPQGRPFWEVQKYILSLFNRGIILAINSKNDKEEVLKVFEKHPSMILKEHHFVSMQINWDDKISNMKFIAREINIGLEALVYVDDDKFNREMVTKALPQVRVVDLPEDPAYYLQTLQELDDFSVLQITREDQVRGKMYAQNQQRRDFEKTAANLTEYLTALQMKVTMIPPSEFSIPRMSQLTLKTNQWNMTTRRYQEEDILKMANDSSYLIQAIQVEDKFGDNGLVGLIIIRKTKQAWHIDTCLLSCRVIGRRLEEALIGDVIQQAQKVNVKMLRGEFIPTKKNAPAKDVYRELGFKEVDHQWQFEIKNGFSIPEFIQIKKEYRGQAQSNLSASLRD